MVITEQGKADYSLKQPDNLVELFNNSVKKYTDNLLFGLKNTELKEYHWITYKEVGDRVNNLRGGLNQLGVNKGDSIGIISDNSPEWAIGAFASYGLGAKWVPMYPVELESVWHYIIKDAKIKVLFVVNDEISRKVKTLTSDIPTLKHIILIEGSSKDSLEELENKGKQNPVELTIPDSKDLAAIVYTSGTTGNPKGVMLSHGNLSSNTKAGSSLFPKLTEKSRAISMLPWAHSYGQTAELYNFIELGASIGLIESIDTLSEDFGLINPTHAISVPRLWHKIYDGILKMMDDGGGIKKKLFDSALKEAENKRKTGKSGLKLKILDKLVFAKVRARFGTNITESLTASAKTSEEVTNFFYDIGVPIYDCWGLTETSPAVTMNSPTDYRLGSVGKVVEKVRVKVDDNDELIVYGPNVMQGYLNKPEKTNEVMTEDDGFRTGDKGRFDEDGFLFITGRIKEEFKLENGKYVHPAAIEEQIKRIPWISNCFLYGDGKAYTTCLIYPDMELLKKVSEELGITKPSAKLEHIFHTVTPELHKFVIDSIEEHLKESVAKYEIPRNFHILEDDFTLENGMLTQTLKLKRMKVMEKYQSVLESLYSS